MAFSLTGERPVTPASSSPQFLGTLLYWPWRVVAAYRRRAALENLLQMETHRLDDLGITRSDVKEAIRLPDRNAGILLAAARAHAARLG